MSSKPENTFIAAVHRRLPKGFDGPHLEKMHNAYRGGTPDVWYSGRKGDLWVEYKYLTKIPARSLILPDLSTLQREWLLARHHEGRNVAVIVGCPEGGVLYRDPVAWGTELAPADFRGLVLPKEQLARFILDQVGARHCPSSKQSYQPQRLSTELTGSSPPHC